MVVLAFKRRPQPTKPGRLIDRRFLKPAASVAVFGLLLALWPALISWGQPAHFDIAAHQLRVIDGDTIDYLGERVRIENIDTPEVGHAARCKDEARLADRATLHARNLVARATRAQIQRSGEDAYGRTLARIQLDGRDMGDRMIEAGLARVWTGRREPWF